MRSRTERINSIDKALQSPEGSKKIAWRGKDHFFEVITIHSEMLMFRIENSRTSRQQQLYIKQHNLPEDFFSDPESQKVQNAQESILLKMAKFQEGFMDDLKERKQRDELIITRDGYIVNGNRRTAALKDLGVVYYSCAVLPEDATAKDIYTLEQELQISTDFRMDYDWVNELNNIREGLMNPIYAFDERELAKNLRISQQSLRSKLMTIDLIDQFLSWKKQPGNYSNEKLDTAKQAFEELEKGLKKMGENSISQELFRNEVFILIDNPPKEGRLYDHIRYLVRHFDLVQTKLGTDANENSSTTLDTTTNSENPLNDIIGDELNNTTHAPFSDNLNVVEDSTKIFEAISDAAAEHKDNKDAEAIFSSAKNALRYLSGHLVDRNTNKKEETIATLQEIINVSKKLIKDLEVDGGN